MPVGKFVSCRFESDFCYGLQLPMDVATESNLVCKLCLLEFSSPLDLLSHHASEAHEETLRARFRRLAGAIL
jgi:hypothetical protein